MSSSSDIEKLFDHFGGDANAYQEIGRENDARTARTRWPLLVTLDLTQPTIPEIGQRREARPQPPVAPAPAVDRQDTTPKDVASVTRAKAPLFTRSHRRDIPPVAVAAPQPAAPSGASRFGALGGNEESAAQTAPVAAMNDPVAAQPAPTAPAPQIPFVAPFAPVAPVASAAPAAPALASTQAAPNPFAVPAVPAAPATPGASAGLFASIAPCRLRHRFHLSRRLPPLRSAARSAARSAPRPCRLRQFRPLPLRNPCTQHRLHRPRTRCRAGRKHRHPRKLMPRCQSQRPCRRLHP